MITKEEIKEYKELSELVQKCIVRLNEIDAKIEKSTKGGGNYTRLTPERDTNVYIDKI